MRPLGIDLLGIGSHDVSHDVAHHVEHLVVRVHSVRKVLRRLVVLVLILEAAFLELNNARHQRTVLELKLYFLYILIIISHNVSFLL